MRNTGSTRTATPCSSSEALAAPTGPTGGAPGTRAARRGALLAALVVALALLLAPLACVKPMVSGDFEPAPGQPRLDADGARDALSAALATECPRLASERRAPTGEARVSVQVSGTGDVLTSRLTTRVEDARINDLFGTIAARMRFIPPADAAGKAYTGRMRMGYSCATDVAVGTVDLF